MGAGSLTLDILTAGVAGGVAKGASLAAESATVAREAKHARSLRLAGEAVDMANIAAKESRNVQKAAMGLKQARTSKHKIKVTFGPKAMGKPDSGCPGSKFRTYPLSNFMSIESIPKIFWVGLVQHCKETFFVSEISADPMGSKTGKKNTHTSFCRLFRTKSHYGTQILGSAKFSAGLGVFLKILDCGIFFKKISYHFLVLFFLIFIKKLSKSKGQ